MLMTVFVSVSGYSVLAIHGADGHADESALAYEREACGAALHVHGAAGQNPESFLFLLVVLLFIMMFVVIVMMPHFVFMLLVLVLFLLHGPEQCRFGVARYLVVIGLAAEPVEMPG
ncbi:MAG: hypothetical protein F4Z95_03565, partial [Gammaproteobacteria bacterium]|nr:hypothetical protein [Gammaproteobacteria bacterium]